MKDGSPLLNTWSSGLFASFCKLKAIDVMTVDIDQTNSWEKNIRRAIEIQFIKIATVES